MNVDAKVALGVAAAVAAVGVALVATRSAPAASSPPAGGGSGGGGGGVGVKTPPGLPVGAALPRALHITIGPGDFDVTVAPGDTLTIALPPGSTWSGLIIGQQSGPGVLHKLSVSGAQPATIPATTGTLATATFRDAAGTQLVARLFLQPPMRWTRLGAGELVPPGALVRMSAPLGLVTSLLAPLGVPANADAWPGILATPAVQGNLQPQPGTMQAWVPGARLPDDWPSDDAAAASEFHAEWLFAGPQPMTAAVMALDPGSTAPLVWIGKPIV